MCVKRTISFINALLIPSGRVLNIKVKLTWWSKSGADCGTIGSSVVVTVRFESGSPGPGSGEWMPSGSVPGWVFESVYLKTAKFLRREERKVEKNIPDNSSNIRVLTRLVIRKHICQHGGTHPVQAVRIGCGIGLNDNWVSLSNCQFNSCNVHWLKKRSVGFNNGQWMMVDREPEISEGPSMRNTYAVSNSPVRKENMCDWKGGKESEPLASDEIKLKKKAQ